MSFRPRSYHGHHNQSPHSPYQQSFGDYYKNQNVANLNQHTVQHPAQHSAQHASHPHHDVEALEEPLAPRLPERSSPSKLFMVLMCFSCCMCVLTIVGACFLIPTERLREPSLPHMSSTMVRIMQLKTHDNDENRLDLPVLQTLFPEWRSTSSDSRFNVDRVLADLIVAVRELARRR